ncbi:MAG TPA: ABC transporter ATP-binding protein [Chiayiivirga sp.]|nr:ABC transporter ATP-binding protein [Chiayiivirga sp.]
MPLLETRALSKRYGDTVALEQLDLAVHPGEVVCLLGANGAGKTTTLNLLLGFLAPTSGEARVAGRVVHEDPRAARSALGYLPEVVQLYPLLSGIETLRYFNDLAGGARVPANALHDTLSTVGLQRDAHDRRVGLYSKGMRQKLGLAIALSKGAQTLLLDEPLSGLDPKAANELVALVRGLADERRAVLAVTHDIFRAQQMADRIGIMREGRLVETVDPRAMSAAEIEELYVHHLRDAA